MTVIVWDSETLATDRQASDGTHKWEASKAWYANTDMFGMCIITGHGFANEIVKQREWIKRGASPTDWSSNPMGAEMVVVNKEGVHVFHPESPHPVFRGNKPCAFGYGADYAYGALAMGASAEQAVQAANIYSLHCGKGVECFSLVTKGELNGKED